MTLYNASRGAFKWKRTDVNRAVIHLLRVFPKGCLMTVKPGLRWFESYWQKDCLHAASLYTPANLLNGIKGPAFKVANLLA